MAANPHPDDTARSILRIISALVLSFITTSAVNAASFPCDGRLSAQERLICADKRLSALDYRLSALYQMALEITEAKQNLRIEQRLWLSTKRPKCLNTTCLLTLSQARIDELTTFIQQHATPSPPVISGSIHHRATSAGSYCEPGDELDWFSVSLETHDDLISGSIDGIYNCGQKVWGPIDITGKRLGNVALVQFNASFSDENAPPSEGIIVVAHKRIYWRILSEVAGESYVPESEVISFGQ